MGGGGSSSGVESEDDGRSSSDGVGSSDADDGTESDDDDPNDVHPDLSTTTTTDAAAAIEIDPDSDSETETESEIDAELFFSNLIKSASSSSCGDSEDDDPEDGDADADADEVMLDVEIGVEIPGAPEPRGDGVGDRYHDYHNGNHNDKVVRREPGDPAMMVREGWDGALVFATDIGTQGRGGVLDVAFERSSSWSRERAPSISRPSHRHLHSQPYTSTHASATTARAGGRTMSVSSGLNLPLDVIAELQAAAETTLLGPGFTPAMSMSIMDSGSALSDTEEGAEVGEGGGEGGDETDGGETTDDELPFVPLPGMEGMGVGMRFMLPPTAPPMLSVNPDVTMSPSISKSTNRSEFLGESPRPAEILQRQQMQMQRRWTASGDGSAIITDTPQTQAQALTNSPEKLPFPRMGVFDPPGHTNGLSFSANSKASAVIGTQTAKGSIPSPFAKLARSRGSDMGTAGGGTSTAASSPVRGRKRRASVSTCLLSCLSTYSPSSLLLMHRVGPCSRTSRRSLTSAPCGSPRRVWTCSARFPRHTCTPCSAATSSPRALAACLTSSCRRARRRTA